jgi:dihydroflavonol-4-reductase
VPAARRRGSTAISNETIWADPDDPLLDPYRRSKILAERAAWDFIAKAQSRTTLTTILPGAVFGPILPGGDPASVWVIDNLLRGRPARLLDLGLSVVDVRDLAAVHVAALTAPQAPGQRYLATGNFMWMPDIARVLRDGLGRAAAKVPRKVLPNAMVRVLALAMPQLRMFVSDLGQRRDADNGKARGALGFDPRPADATLLDCARSIERPHAG